MRLAILYPHFAHPAVEERYGSWQAQLFLRRSAPGAEWIEYREDEAPADVAGRADADHCLVVTDPLLLVGSDLVRCLAAALTNDVAAAIPLTNAGQAAQRAEGIEPYLTIRQFEQLAADRANVGSAPQAVIWSGDPGIYLCSTAFLRSTQGRAANVLDGRNVAVASAAYVHRWTQMRSQPREDLLPLIPLSARTILEFGCAEGLLGETVKERQECRFVGIEIDPQAASSAERRLDHVYHGDATELLGTIPETFDCIIGGDVLEHLGDPWAFLLGLRKLANEDAVLLLSIPNVGNWAIVDDLLRGRFDYAYVAITCAGHLRFFTRTTITDALEIAGWSVESIDPLPPIVNQATEAFMDELAKTDLQHDRRDLLTPGFYVVARNRK